MDKSEYFYRTAVFSRRDNQVALANIDNPEEVTALDSWLGMVLSLADGSHTLADLFAYIAAQYPNGAPTDLEQTLTSVLERLQEANLLSTSKLPVALPYYLAGPIEQLDLEKARRLMLEDGYVVH